MITSGLVLNTCVGAMLIMNPTHSRPLPTKVSTTETNNNNSQQQHVQQQPISVKQQTVTLLRDPRIIATCACSFLYLSGLSVVFTHVAAYAGSHGHSPTLGRALLSALGAAALTGKVGLAAITQMPCSNTFVVFTTAVTLTGRAMLFVVLLLWFF